MANSRSLIWIFAVSFPNFVLYVLRKIGFKQINTNLDVTLGGRHGIYLINWPRNVVSNYDVSCYLSSAALCLVAKRCTISLWGVCGV